MLRKEYHGGSFSGSNSRKLLQIVDRLESLNPPSSCGKFESAFKSLCEVVSLCYGAKLLSESQCEIAIFGKDYMKLCITVTLKLHAVMFHVAEFCLMMGQGLSPWIEQTGESIHHDFKET